MLHFAVSFLDPSLKHFRFVTDIDDRDGFFRQVREAILSLANEPDVSNEPQPSANSIPDNSATTDADMPPKKKVKVNPFDWFQRAPDGTNVQSASRHYYYSIYRTTERSRIEGNSKTRD